MQRLLLLDRLLDGRRQMTRGIVLLRRHLGRVVRYAVRRLFMVELREVWTDQIHGVGRREERGVFLRHQLPSTDIDFQVWGTKKLPLSAVDESRCWAARPDGLAVRH